MGGNIIQFLLGADNSNLKHGFEEAKEHAKEFSLETREILTGLFAGLSIETIVSDFAKIGDLSEQFGVSAEAIQRVRGAAETSGTSIEYVAKQMAKLNIEARKIADGSAAKGIEIARAASSQAGKGFEKLNINAEEFAKMPMDEQLLAIAEGMEKIPEEGDRIAAAYDLFGAKGREIIPILMQGHENLQDEFRNTAVASNEMVARLKTVDDTLARAANKVKVGGAYILYFFDVAIESIAALSTAAATGIGTVFSATLDSMNKLAHGDFSGAGKSLSEGFKTAAEQANEISKGLYEDLTAANSEEPKFKDTELPENAGLETAEKRKSIEERIAQIREEHAEKQLDLETQILDLTQKQADAEVRANTASDPKERMAAEDEAVNAEKAILELRDRQAKEQKKADDEAAAQRRKDAADQRRARLAEAKEQLDQEKQKARDSLRARQGALGFASGINNVEQGLRGVNYQVVNTEAEKSVQLQIEANQLLKQIAEKDWKAEITETD